MIKHLTDSFGQSSGYQTTATHLPVTHLLSRYVHRSWAVQAQGGIWAQRGWVAGDRCGDIEGWAVVSRPALSLGGISRHKYSSRSDVGVELSFF